MGKKPPIAKQAGKSLDDDSFKRLTGSNHRAFSNQLINQVIRSLFLPELWGKETRDEAIHSVMQAMLEITPRDALEGVLGAQMVATHNTAMECLRRAALENQTFEGRNMALSHAQKLLRLYLEQMKALNKHRGKSDQKVVIEHVNVAPGGKAIVGNVEINKKESAEKSTDEITRTATPTITIEAQPAQKKSASPVKNAKRKK